MQFDRFVPRAVTRMVGARLPGRKAAPATDTPVVPPKDDLKGSGSWANEWAGARSAVERAKALATRGKARKAKTKTTAVDSIPEGSVRTRPLMATREVKLHNWIADRLEAEAPTCSLHAGVALSAFLASDQAHPGLDPLAGLIADLLIVDAEGQPVIALIRENTADPAKHLLLLDALLDADLPIVDLQPRPSLSGLWSEIAAQLPLDG